MKNLFTKLFLFAVLSVSFSGLTACSNSANTQNGTIAGNASTPSSNASGATKETNFPPVPSGLYQASIKDLEGNEYKLEDKKGKVVLVNLWATWCGPCIAEMPHLKEMQEKHQAKGFEVLGLNTGDNETGEPEPVDKIKTFAADKGLNYPLGYADEKFFSEMLKITRMAGIPQSILINREGQMIGIFKGGGARVINEMKQSVEKVMSE
jgi:thiol-disulfide isomerase/thioredoxin